MLLATTAVLNAPAVRPNGFTPLLPHGWCTIASATVLLCSAFTGQEAVVHLRLLVMAGVGDAVRSTLAWWR